ncbi:unnamed protein product [Heterobilharzia americana]|nr:unnamed protein product [Heterobilharzia americana]
MPRIPTLHRPPEVKDFENCFHQRVLVKRFVENSNYLRSRSCLMQNGYTQKSYLKNSTFGNNDTMGQKEIDCIKQIERQLPLEYPCITIFYSDLDHDLEKKIILFLARRWDREDPYASVSPLVSELEAQHGRGWRFERVLNPIKVGRQSVSVKPRTTFCYRLEPDPNMYKFYRDDETQRSNK